MPPPGSRLHEIGKVAPMLDLEGANIPHATREPRQCFERVHRQRHIHQAIVRRYIDAALNALKTVAIEHRANLGIGLRQPFGMGQLGLIP